MWHFRIQFSSHGGVGWMVGLDDLRGLVQPMILWFYEFVPESCGIHWNCYRDSRNYSSCESQIGQGKMKRHCRRWEWNRVTIKPPLSISGFLPPFLSPQYKTWSANWRFGLQTESSSFLLCVLFQLSAVLEQSCF